MSAKDPNVVILKEGQYIISDQSLMQMFNQLPRSFKFKLVKALQPNEKVTKMLAKSLDEV